MKEARTRRLVFCLLMSAFALGSVSQLNADTLFFANGRSMSVRDHRIDGEIMTVTLRHGGEARFNKALVVRIVPEELPVEPAATAPTPVTPTAAPEPLDARPFADLIETVALKHGIDPTLVHAVVKAESNYQADARSHVGARGLMQVMPSTGRDLGVKLAKDLYDPEKNLEAGVLYLKFLLGRFDGNLKRAIAAYNAGPAAVRKFRGIPPYRETQDYVKKVLTNMKD